MEKILKIRRMRYFQLRSKLLPLKLSQFQNSSTSCISENNSKFNSTRIKQNPKRIYMENSQS